MKKQTLVILIALLSAGLLASCGGNNNAANTPVPDPVVAAPIRASNEIIVDGVVVPVRSAALNLTSGGIVDEILVSEGAPVSAGEPILRLHAARQQAAVAQAQATLGAAEARLAELTAGPRSQEIEAAAAAVDAANAQIDRLNAGASTEDIAAAQAVLDGAEAATGARGRIAATAHRGQKQRRQRRGLAAAGPGGLRPRIQPAGHRRASGIASTGTGHQRLQRRPGPVTGRPTGSDGRRDRRCPSHRTSGAGPT